MTSLEYYNLNSNLCLMAPHNGMHVKKQTPWFMQVQDNLTPVLKDPL